MGKGSDVSDYDTYKVDSANLASTKKGYLPVDGSGSGVSEDDVPNVDDASLPSDEPHAAPIALSRAPPPNVLLNYRMNLLADMSLNFHCSAPTFKRILSGIIPIYKLFCTMRPCAGRALQKCILKAWPNFLTAKSTVPSTQMCAGL